ncbi:DUF3426 domain-containing protein, partial [Magnetococcales bacterium HHB-1]
EPELASEEEPELASEEEPELASEEEPELASEEEPELASEEEPELASEENEELASGESEILEALSEGHEEIHDDLDAMIDSDLLEDVSPEELESLIGEEPVLESEDESQALVDSLLQQAEDEDASVGESVEDSALEGDALADMLLDDEEKEALQVEEEKTAPEEVLTEPEDKEDESQALVDSLLQQAEGEDASVGESVEDPALEGDALADMLLDEEEKEALQVEEEKTAPEEVLTETEDKEDESQALVDSLLQQAEDEDASVGESVEDPALEGDALADMLLDEEKAVLEPEEAQASPEVSEVSDVLSDEEAALLSKVGDHESESESLDSEPVSSSAPETVAPEVPESPKVSLVKEARVERERVSEENLQKESQENTDNKKQGREGSLDVHDDSVQESGERLGVDSMVAEEDKTTVVSKTSLEKSKPSEDAFSSDEVPDMDDLDLDDLEDYDPEGFDDAFNPDDIDSILLEDDVDLTKGFEEDDEAEEPSVSMDDMISEAERQGEDDLLKEISTDDDSEERSGGDDLDALLAEAGDLVDASDDPISGDEDFSLDQSGDEDYQLPSDLEDLAGGMSPKELVSENLDDLVSEKLDDDELAVLNSPDEGGDGLSDLDLLEEDKDEEDGLQILEEINLDEVEEGPDKGFDFDNVDLDAATILSSQTDVDLNKDMEKLASFADEEVTEKAPSQPKPSMSDRVMEQIEEPDLLDSAPPPAAKEVEKEEKKEKKAVPKWGWAIAALLLLSFLGGLASQSPWVEEMLYEWNSPVKLTSVEGNWRQVDYGTLLVLNGKVQNNSRTSRLPELVRVTLLDEKNTPVVSSMVVSGRVLGEKHFIGSSEANMRRYIEMQGDTQRYANSKKRKKFSPEQEISFQTVFINPPEKATRYRIELEKQVVVSQRTQSPTPKESSAIRSYQSAF